MRTIVANVVLIALASSGILVAQRARDEWRDMKQSLQGGSLDHSLGDAQLTIGDRKLIYEQVYDPAYLFWGDREERRKTVLSSRMGAIALADGGEQIVVWGPNEYCGATGNCLIWIFARLGGKLRLVLRAHASTLVIKNHSTQGFHDVFTYQNMSGGEGFFRVFRWHGSEYREVDCYSAAYGYKQGDPTTDCPQLPH